MALTRPGAVEGGGVVWSLPPAQDHPGTEPGAPFAKPPSQRSVCLAQRRKDTFVLKSRFPCSVCEFPRMAVTFQATRPFCSLGAAKPSLRFLQEHRQVHHPRFPGPLIALTLGNASGLFSVVSCQRPAGSSPWVSLTCRCVEAEEDAPVCQGHPSPVGTNARIWSVRLLSLRCLWPTSPHAPCG